MVVFHDSATARSARHGRDTVDANLILRVRAEFSEMPGLYLTFPQACRLWGVDRSTCEALVAALLEADIVRLTRTGAIVRKE